MSIKNLVDFLENKEILILGFGREGKSSYRFLREHFPEKKITIGDKNTIALDDKFVSFDCGDDYLEHLDRYDIVLKSPGIAFIGVKYPTSTLVTCQLDLYLQFTDNYTVGITGTKGKTTTSTLVYEMLRAAGYNASLIGNIGVPVFDDLMKDETDKIENKIAVIEMSSHQLEFTRHSPRTAVVTNIYEEHLDHYEDGFAGYVAAKMNIVKHQNEGDNFVYNDEQGIGEYLDLSCVKSTSHGVKFDAALASELIGGNKNLLGDHNKMDVLTAREAVKCVLQTSAPQSISNLDDTVRRALSSFTGIPHRMEFFGTFDEIDWYNDSIATIPQAVMCAVRAIDNIGTLIIGGLDRGISYDEFEDFLSESRLDNIICMPQTGSKIADALEKKNCPARIIRVENMVQAVEAAKKNTKRGKAVLLSPAAASYNVYRNFEEKGNDFKRLATEEVGGRKE